LLGWKDRAVQFASDGYRTSLRWAGARKKEKSSPSLPPWSESRAPFA
jgi:hypothetical protein